MKIILLIAALALATSGIVSAKTVPSTFDDHCNVNYVNGGGSFAGAARDICPGPEQPNHCGRCETKAQARK